MIVKTIKRGLKTALFFIIFVFLSFLSNPSLYSQTVPSVDSTKINKSQIKELIQELNTIQKAIVHNKNAIATIADSSFLPELLFQLSELELRHEKLNFELSLMSYDLKSNLYEKSKLDKLPDEPLLTYEKTFRINNQIIQNYPAVPFLNKIRYRNAICFFEIGQIDKAKQIFSQLVQAETDSTLLAEIIFRLAECYFNEADFEGALTSYQQILKSWDSQFFAMALYKIAWCHYKMNNISAAISAFYYLLNDINLLEKVDTDLLGKSQIDLQQEVIDYIAISFCDFGGVQSLVKFINKMGGTQYSADFLFKMGEVFLQRDFYDDAITAYEFILSHFLTCKKLPLVYCQLFDCYEKTGNMKKAFSLHDQFILACTVGSNWQTTNNSKEDNNLYENNLKELKYKTATHFLNSADSSYALQNFKLAAKKYVKFLKTFPSDKRSEHAQYCLAECFFNLRQYSSAAKTYEMFVKKFPQSELVEDAAFNHIVCYDKILENSTGYANNNDIKLKIDHNSANLITACKKYLLWLPNSEKVPEILLKLAELFFRFEKYDLGEKYASSALKTLLTTDADQRQKITAINLLAHLKFTQGKYLSAKKLYKALMLQNPDSTELVQKSKTKIASADFKIGEQLIQRGKNKQAANQFEITANTASDPQIAQQSFFEAGVQFEKIGKLQKAALNYETLYKKYPHSKHAKEAIYRAGVLREKLEQYHLAASNYLELNRLLHNSHEGASALFSAGLAYEKCKDWSAMVKTFSRYLNKFPAANDRILEAQFKVAFAYEQNSNLPFANLWYQKLLYKYDQFVHSNQFADEYFAANAAFRLGEMKYTQFRATKLRPPFQFNLKRKQEAFNKLLKQYVKVTNYNIADWTTAAFYRVGLAYEEFCQDIINSPTPPNLNKQQQNSYWATIQQQWIIPLQQESLKYHKMNQQLAIKNSVENEWVEKSRSRLIFLNRKLASYQLGSGNNRLMDTAGSGVIKKKISGRSL